MGIIKYFFDKYKNDKEIENKRIEVEYFGNQFKNIHNDINKNKEEKNKEVLFNNLYNNTYLNIELLHVNKINEIENLKQLLKEQSCNNEYVKLLNTTINDFVSRIEALKRYLNETIDGLKNDNNKTNLLNEIKIFLPELNIIEKEIQKFYNSNYLISNNKIKEFLLDEIKYNRYNDFAKNKTHEIRIKNLNNVEFINNSTEKLLNDLKKDTIEIIKEKEKVFISNDKQKSNIKNIQKNVIKIDSSFNDSFIKINDVFIDYINKNIGNNEDVKILSNELQDFIIQLKTQNIDKIEKVEEQLNFSFRSKEILKVDEKSKKIIKIKQ